jgi:hypothetical protein
MRQMREVREMPGTKGLRDVMVTSEAGETKRVRQ